MENLIDKIKEKAERLYTIRRTIEEVERRQAEEIQELKLERDTLQAELVTDMNTIGISSLKVSSGNSFAKVSRKSLLVNDLDPFAIKWALDNRAVSINKIEAMKILRNSTKLPRGYEIIATEYISVRKAKNNDNGTDQREDQIN